MPISPCLASVIGQVSGNPVELPGYRTKDACAETHSRWLVNHPHQNSNHLNLRFDN